MYNQELYNNVLNNILSIEKQKPNMEHLYEGLEFIRNNYLKRSKDSCTKILLNSSNQEKHHFFDHAFKYHPILKELVALNYIQPIKSIHQLVDEKGETVEQLAISKNVQLFDIFKNINNYDIAVYSDDTVIEFLNTAITPGVHTKRFSVEKLDPSVVSYCIKRYGEDHPMFNAFASFMHVMRVLDYNLIATMTSSGCLQHYGLNYTSTKSCALKSVFPTLNVKEEKLSVRNFNHMFRTLNGGFSLEKVATEEQYTGSHPFDIALLDCVLKMLS